MNPEIPVAASFSGGTSSWWQIQAVIEGLIPRPKHFAVFCADTGEEHWWTYDAMNEVEHRCRRAEIPFTRVKHPRGFLGDHILDAISTGSTRMDNPPFYVDKCGTRGQISQRCTREFKTYPIRRAVSAWLKSISAPKRVVTWIGFAADEQHRAIKADGKRDVQWETLDFPAIRFGRTRAMQREELARWIGHDAPKFSMCTFCPHKTPARWAATEGEDLERAMQIDDAIRDSMDDMGITDGPVYCCDRLVPLRAAHGSAELNQKIKDAWDSSDSGVDGCASGRCFL